MVASQLGSGRQIFHFPILVFGGPHANIPLHDAAGPIIGELIVSTGTSAVLDLVS
jgi:hypothetical protein